MRTILIVAAALALSPSIGRAAKPETDAGIGAFNVCVRHTAMRLEPSGESPAAVADAAIYACQALEVAALNLIIKDQSAGMTADDLHRTALYYGSAAVVIARLCRKTQDCEMANIERAH